MAKFVLLMPWGRVGSNLVMNYFEHAITKPRKLGNEILNGSKLLEEQLERLRNFYAIDSNCLAVTKESLGAMVDVSSVANFLVENKVKLIKLSRRNILKTAISQIRAEEYAKYTLERTGLPKWGVGNDDEPLHPIEIPIEQLEPLCALLEQQNSLLDKNFSNFHSIELFYENLLGDMSEELRRLSSFMGIDYVKFRPRFKKATPDHWQLSVLNHQEILSWVPARYVCC